MMDGSRNRTDQDDGDDRHHHPAGLAAPRQRRAIAATIGMTVVQDLRSFARLPPAGSLFVSLTVPTESRSRRRRIFPDADLGIVSVNVIESICL